MRQVVSFASPRILSLRQRSRSRSSCRYTALVIPRGVPPLPVCGSQFALAAPRARTHFPASAQAASAGSRVAPGLYKVGARSIRRLYFHLARPGDISARRLQLPARGRLVRHQVKRVACQPMVLVGKWRPNDSFKPNPLRSCNDPPASRGGSA
jgi:hypothetical protein